MNPKQVALSPEEARTLRREVAGAGNLLRLGLITITDKGRAWVQADDERIRRRKSEGGKREHLSQRKRSQIASIAATAKAQQQKGGGND